jgi:hypothetical protein
MVDVFVRLSVRARPDWKQAPAQADAEPCPAHGHAAGRNKQAQGPQPAGEHLRRQEAVVPVARGVCVPWVPVHALQVQDQQKAVDGDTLPAPHHTVADDPVPPQGVVEHRVQEAALLSPVGPRLHHHCRRLLALTPHQRELDGPQCRPSQQLDAQGGVPGAERRHQRYIPPGEGAHGLTGVPQGEG